MKLPVVIGYGNPLRQDDGIGRRAAELLEEKLTPGGVDITCCYQLTPELAAVIADAPVVLFFDAAVDQTPGEVRCRSIAPQTLAADSHHLLPEQLLELVLSLTGSAPSAFLITGGIAATGFGEMLTPPAEQCAARMAAAGLRILRNT